jgi:hypothetical protein
MARSDIATLGFIVREQRFWIRAKGNAWKHADHKLQPRSAYGTIAFPGEHLVCDELAEAGLLNKFKNKSHQMNTLAARSVSYVG